MKIKFKEKIYRLSFRKKFIPWSLTRIISEMNNVPNTDLLQTKGNRLEGKVALVTGGSKGIGLAITKRLLQDGAKVIITGRNAKQLNETTSALNTDNVKSLVWDISETTTNESKFLSALAFWGGIDILVNNAGVTTDRERRLLFEDMDKTHVHFVHDINVIGTSNMCHLFVSKVQKGSILNIVSNTGILPARDAYCTSKWALYSFTKAFGESMRGKGVTVNGICPGPIMTDMTWTYTSESSLYRQGIPNHRIGFPEEIAELAFMQILSGLNGQTAEITVCDGGESLN